MKKYLKLLGIIAMVAVIGFSLTACDDGNGSGGNDKDSENNGNGENGNNGNGTVSLLGTWNRESSSFDYIYFDNTSWTGVINRPSDGSTGGYTYQGTYSQNGNAVTLSISSAVGNESVVGMNVGGTISNNNRLQINSSGSANMNGTYIKR